MKNVLATTALVLLMGGSAYAAPAQFNTYQAKATDIDASKFIGQTVYASKIDVGDQANADARKDWDNIGEINELVIGRDGAVKAVVLGVGGFLGMGEKNVAVAMNDIKFVRDGDRPDDYFLVVNSTKEALNAAPAYKTPDDVKAAMNTQNMDGTAAVPTTTADNTAATTTDNTMTKPADTANNTAANSTAVKPADTTTTTADTGMTKPAAKTTDQASSTMNDNNAANTDATTTASTKTGSAVQTTMDENRVRLTPPNITREGYQAAQVSELTADKLEGARIYGPKDEDVGEINRLVMNDNGQVKLFVLDIGGFLGIGEHQIAVTPQELNIVRNAKGDDFRVYINADKQALKAQPEYKMQ